MSEEIHSTDVAHTNGIIHVSALQMPVKREICWRLPNTGFPSREYLFVVSRPFHHVQSPKGLKAAQGDQMLSLFLF